MLNYETYWDNKECHAYHPSVRMRNNFILKTLRSSTGNTLIDVGCGDGQLLRSIHTTYPNLLLTGCDYSDAVIQRNKARNPDIHFIHADLGVEMNLQQNFDIVICSEVIEHIDNWQMVMKNLVGLATKNGIIIVTTQAGKRYPSDIANGHLKHFVLSELNSMAQQLGCVVVSSYRKGFPFYDLQKFVHSLLLPLATKVQEGSLTSGKKVLFSFVYRLFTLTPATQKFGTQIYAIYKKSL